MGCVGSNLRTQNPPYRSHGTRDEMSSPRKAGLKSPEIVDRTLVAGKTHYGANADADWAANYYQYANRLVHLQLLRERGIDAHLFFIYFFERSNGPVVRMIEKEQFGDMKSTFR